MINSRILSKAIQQLQDITGTTLTLYEKNGTRITGDMNIADDDTSVRELIRSAADSMTIGSTTYLKVYDDDMPVYYLAASGGQNPEITGRVAVSELQNLLALSHERMDRNHFIQNVLLDNLLAPDIHSEARKLKIREDVNRIVYLTETDEKDTDLALQTLKAMYTASGNEFLTIVDASHIAVVSEVNGQEAAAKAAHTLSDMLNAEAMIPVRVSYGLPTNLLDHLSQSYKEAQLAIDVGRIFYPDLHVISYSNLGIGRLIFQLPHSLCELFLRETFDHDVFAELDEETLTTIRQFFDNNLNISETARQLYIHRNTLVYRIEKLQKTTGLDIRRFDEAMTFKIAMMVNNYLKNTQK
ncbi:MAG: helix-turn-helix domain-containing protein [Lachnospiraceae bacterium]|nr:helix-turn-helix domain-containing protein [Lachnospiraceae bacterium]